MTRRRVVHLPGDEILDEVADLLIAQNQLLADIRDRLLEPTVAGQPEPEAAVEPVQVREPAPAVPPAGEGYAGDGNGGEVGAVQVTEPAAPSPRRPAKKAAAKKATPVKTAGKTDG